MKDFCIVIRQRVVRCVRVMKSAEESERRGIRIIALNSWEAMGNFWDGGQFLDLYNHRKEVLVPLVIYSLTNGNRKTHTFKL